MVWVAAGTNCITDTEDMLRDMLCATAQFRAWVGESSAALARAYVFSTSIPDPADARWPEDGETYSADWWDHLRNYAIIGTSSEEGFIYEYAAAPNEFLTAGTLELQFYRYFDVEDIQLDKDTRTALNEVGGIIQAMLPLAGTAEYHSINAVRIIRSDWGPEDQDPDAGRQFRVVADFEWSMGNNLTGNA